MVTSVATSTFTRPSVRRLIASFVLHHLAFEIAVINACTAQASQPCTFAFAYRQLSRSLPAVLTDGSAGQFVLDIIGTVVKLMDLLAFAGGRICRDFDGIFQQTLGKSLIASPSRVAENSIVCLRQRVSPAICSMSWAKPMSGLGGLAVRISVSTAWQSKFSSLYCSRRRPVGNHDVWFSLKTSVVHMATPPVMVAISDAYFRQLTGVFSNLHRQFARWRQD